MLCMPFGHDTLDNAQRAEDLGLARTLPQKHFTADRLASELIELLENPRYQQRSDEIGAEIRAEDGTNHACDEIEETLERPTPAEQTATAR